MSDFYSSVHVLKLPTVLATIDLKIGPNFQVHFALAIPYNTSIKNNYKEIEKEVGMEDKKVHKQG